jgi:hypothetical protein
VVLDCETGALLAGFLVYCMTTISSWEEEEESVRILFKAGGGLIKVWEVNAFLNDDWSLCYSNFLVA